MSTDTRIQVHALIDKLDARQIQAVHRLLEVMIDDEADDLTEQDRAAIAEGQRSQLVGLEVVLADFGLTLEDWEKMGESPVPEAARNE